MAEKAPRTPRTPEEKTQLKSLGRAIWRSETSGEEKGEEKKASWTENRRKYISRAGKLLKGLHREGLQLTPVAPAER